MVIGVCLLGASQGENHSATVTVWPGCRRCGLIGALQEILPHAVRGDEIIPESKVASGPRHALRLIVSCPGFLLSRNCIRHGVGYYDRYAPMSRLCFARTPRNPMVPSQIKALSTTTMPSKTSTKWFQRRWKDKPMSPQRLHLAIVTLPALSGTCWVPKGFQEQSPPACIEAAHVVMQHFPQYVTLLIALQCTTEYPQGRSGPP